MLKLASRVVSIGESPPWPAVSAAIDEQLNITDRTQSEQLLSSAAALGEHDDLLALSEPLMHTRARAEPGREVAKQREKDQRHPERHKKRLPALLSIVNSATLPATNIPRPMSAATNRSQDRRLGRSTRRAYRRLYARSGHDHLRTRPNWIQALQEDSGAGRNVAWSHRLMIRTREPFAADRMFGTPRRGSSIRR